MARTLSTTRPAPTETKSRAQDEVLAVIWACTAELWLIGERWAFLTPKCATLKCQLEAPDAWRHPKYAKASERFRKWSAEIDRHERRVANLLENLARHYGKLSERNRVALVANAGWSQERDPEAFATEMWQRAQRGGDWPCGECGFLDPLRAWLTEAMAKEREA